MRKREKNNYSQHLQLAIITLHCTALVSLSQSSIDFSDVQKNGRRARAGSERERGNCNRLRRDD